MSKQKDQDVNQVKLRAALEEPLRQEIFRMIVDRPKGLSPSEISKEAHLSLSKVSYHVRVLAEAKAILCIKKVPVRGSTQHFYVVNPSIGAHERTLLGSEPKAPGARV